MIRYADDELFTHRAENEVCGDCWLQVTDCVCDGPLMSLLGAPPAPNSVLSVPPGGRHRISPGCSPSTG